VIHKNYSFYLNQLEEYFHYSQQSKDQLQPGEMKKAAVGVLAALAALAVTVPILLVRPAPCRGAHAQPETRPRRRGPFWAPSGLQRLFHRFVHFCGCFLGGYLCSLSGHRRENRQDESQKAPVESEVCHPREEEILGTSCSLSRAAAAG
jgi:hypothetical protein